VIYNAGTLNITDCVVTTNKGKQGGVIQNNGGDVTITASTLSVNVATVNGGVIDSQSGGSVAIINSTLYANEGGDGGGVRNNGVLEITNSTFTDNHASTLGGGVNNTGTATITNTTFSDNSAYNGGGIFNGTSSGTVNFTNTIVANSNPGYDCYNDGGTIGTNINNLVEDYSWPAALAGDPSLGALADNGGSTQTHALLEGSPAIDAGNLAACPGTDQRGITRPQGEGCYIGAFEFWPTYANFSANPLSGAAPLEVYFDNNSQGVYDTCTWDFGDSKTSSQCKDPQHTYTAVGDYTVSLTVEGIGGEDTRVREEYIHVGTNIYLPLLKK